MFPHIIFAKRKFYPRKGLMRKNMDRGVLGSNVGGRYGEREERREIVQVKILEDS